jgi:citrate lyase beta subunit
LNTAFPQPVDKHRRQPVHTVYGGAHLFQAGSAGKLGAIALRALEAHGEGVPEIFPPGIYDRVIEKLRREPVEDYRIDFEDGFGYRGDAEEDAQALRTAKELVKGMETGSLPPFTGIRIKAMTPQSHRRALRTLDIFLSTCDGKLPPGFVVTLPKITSAAQVTALVDVLDEMGSEAGIELMIETPQSLDGARLAQAARGRCTAAHFGAYDYTAAIGVTSRHQDLLHPACDYARHRMQESFAGTGVFLSDGATNILPVGGADVIHRAWRLHYRHIRHALNAGFYQGWDLHPAQLPVRYAAVYAFFAEELEAAGLRLRNFISAAAQATRTGDVFDDAATGQGLLNYFIRGMNCGALSEQEAAQATGLSADDLRTASFQTILERMPGV